MGRGSQVAEQGAVSNQNEANSIFGSLNPFLTSQMIHPSGIDPTTLAAMNTGAQQSAGGAAAGAVGQGGLRAARTRNAGGADAATAASTRAAGETLSKGLLGVQGENAQLKAKQQSGAASELGNIFGHATGAVAGDVNADTNAENASWDWAKDLFVPLATAATSAGAKIATGGG